MEGPFYRSHRNYPRRYYSSPSVREIPVQYVGSEQSHPTRSKSDSAVKIQKVFRGFLVRKSMKKIAEIRREVNDVEKKISTKETVELIRRDFRERLRVNETLMSLLFKLDSVRGVDSGVRNCRKAVIKKAIALQELVDSIVSIPDNNNFDHYNVDQTLHNPPEFQNSIVNSSEAEKMPEAVVGQNLKLAQVEGDANADREVVEADDVAASVLASECAETVGTSENQAESQADSSANPDSLIEGVDDDNELGEQQNVVENQADSQADSSANPDGLIEGVDDDNDIDNELGEQQKAVESRAESPADSSPTHESLMEGADDDNELGEQQNVMEIQQPVAADNKKEGVKEENERSRELLDRMLEDNEKMMRMMAGLFERNEMQTRLLSSLTQRVERLEKAFLCERLRKKKRNAAS